MVFGEVVEVDAFPDMGAACGFAGLVLDVGAGILPDGLSDDAHGGIAGDWVLEGAGLPAFFEDGLGEFPGGFGWRGEFGLGRR